MQGSVEQTIRVCIAGRGKLGDFENAHRALWEVAVLNADQQRVIAERIPIEATTLRGLVLKCGFACKAAEWLIYHNLPLTKESLKDLSVEFHALCISDTGIIRPLFFELYLGASELNRLIVVETAGHH